MPRGLHAVFELSVCMCIPYITRRAKDYEVRRYQPFTVAETVMDAVTGIHQATLESGGVQVNPAGPGMKAFRALAGYLFGGNAQRESLAMTTPVFTDTRGRMQFVVGDKEIQVRFLLVASGCQ